MRSSFTNALIRKFLDENDYLMVGGVDEETKHETEASVFEAIDDSSGDVFVTGHKLDYNHKDEDGALEAVQTGWVRLVLANTGTEQLSDYNVGLEHMVAPLVAEYDDKDEADIAEARAVSLGKAQARVKALEFLLDNLVEAAQDMAIEACATSNFMTEYCTKPAQWAHYNHQELARELAPKILKLNDRRARLEQAVSHGKYRTIAADAEDRATPTQAAA